MANGAGVMGESGPEAIMPLKRGANGKLGVEGSGDRPIQNTVILSFEGAPDAQEANTNTRTVVARVGGGSAELRSEPNGPSASAGLLWTEAAAQCWFCW